jgi:DnaB-like helicase C terminal domain
MNHDRKSKGRSQAAPPLGNGRLKPRKPPGDAVSIANQNVERGEDEWGGQEEAHLNEVAERDAEAQAARKARLDKLLAEEEAADEEDDEGDEEEDDEEDVGEADDEGDDDDDEYIQPWTPPQVVPPSAPAIETDADRMEDYIGRLKERRAGAIGRGLVGASTGLPTLNAATGGLQQLTLLVGTTGSGKTSFAAQAVAEALRHDPKLAAVYYAMDDMTEDDLLDQMVCREAGVDHETLVGEQMSQEEKGKVNAALATLREDVQRRMRTLDHFPNKDGRGESGEDIFGFCHRFMRQVGAERVLVVLDMLNDLPHPRASGSWDEEYLPSIRRIEGDPDRWRLEQVVDLRERSLEVCPGGWPILALCKFRKSVPIGKEPEIEDILGSVDLAYKAMRVFFLVPDPEADPEAPVVGVTLAIKKGRHADMVRLPLLFHRSHFRLEEAKGPTEGGKKAGKKAPRPSSAKQATPSAAFDPLAGMPQKKGKP